MVDNLSILLTHGLLALAFWRLLMRADLDDESQAPPADHPSTASKRTEAAAKPMRAGPNRSRRDTRSNRSQRDA